MTTEEFIKKAKQIHGDKYDYSKTIYKGCKEKVCIMCPIHGEFWQTPSNHLHKTHPQNCPMCNKEVYDTQTFISKARKIHGDKYDYSKVKYINNSTKVCIICPIHGEFWQTPRHHEDGCSCPKCKNKNITLDDFIKKAKQVHGDKYDYSKVEYVNAKEKVIISCKKHGFFEQTPDNHLHGKGCPKCKMRMLEKEIMNCLNDNNIKYIFQASHNNLSWLERQSLDFYLPEYNVAIECQGIQHFKPIDFANKGNKWAYNAFKINKKNDLNKLLLCEKNNVKILYYSNLCIDYPYKVFENKMELLKEIIK